MTNKLYHHPAVYSLAAQDAEFARNHTPSFLRQVEAALKRDPQLLIEPELREELDAFIDAQPAGGRFLQSADQVLPPDWTERHRRALRLAAFQRTSEIPQISRRFKLPPKVMARQVAARLGLAQERDMEEGYFIHSNGLRVYIDYQEWRDGLHLIVKLEHFPGYQKARDYAEQVVLPGLERLGPETVESSVKYVDYVERGAARAHYPTTSVSFVASQKAESQWRDKRNERLEQLASQLGLLSDVAEDDIDSLDQSRRFIHPVSGLKIKLTLKPKKMVQWMAFPTAADLEMTVRLRHPVHNGTTSHYFEQDLLSALQELDPRIQSVQLTQNTYFLSGQWSRLNPVINLERNAETGLLELKPLSDENYGGFRWRLWNHPVLWRRVTNAPPFSVVLVIDSENEKNFWIARDNINQISIQKLGDSELPQLEAEPHHFIALDLATGRLLMTGKIFQDRDHPQKIALLPEELPESAPSNPYYVTPINLTTTLMAFPESLPFLDHIVGTSPPDPETAFQLKRVAAKHGWKFAEEDRNGRLVVQNPVTGEKAILSLCNPDLMRLQILQKNPLHLQEQGTIATEYLPFNPIPKELLDSKIQLKKLAAGVTRWNWMPHGFLHWGPEMLTKGTYTIRELIQYFEITLPEVEQAYETATRNENTPSAWDMIAHLVLVKASDRKSDARPVDHLFADLPQALAAFNDGVKYHGIALTYGIRMLQRVHIAGKDLEVSAYNPAEQFANRLLGASGPVLVRQNLLLQQVSDSDLAGYSAADLRDIILHLSDDSPSVADQTERAIRRLTADASLSEGLLLTASRMTPKQLKQAQSVFTRLRRPDDPLLAASCLLLATEAPTEWGPFSEQILSERVPFAEIRHAIRDAHFDGLPEISNAPEFVGLHDILSLYQISQADAYLAAHHPLTREGLRPPESAFEAIMLLLDVRSRRASGQIASLLPKHAPDKAAPTGLADPYGRSYLTGEGDNFLEDAKREVEELLAKPNPYRIDDYAPLHAGDPIPFKRNAAPVPGHIHILEGNCVRSANLKPETRANHSLRPTNRRIPRTKRTFTRARTLRQRRASTPAGRHRFRSAKAIRRA